MRIDRPDGKPIQTIVIRAARCLVLAFALSASAHAQLVQWETREGELEPSPEVIESEEGPLEFEGTLEEEGEPLFEADLEGYPEEYEGPAEPIEIPLDASAHMEELVDAEQEAEGAARCVPIIYACCGHFIGGLEILSVRGYLCNLDTAIEDPRLLGPEDVGTLPMGRQITVRPNRRTGVRFFVTYVFKQGTLEGTGQFTIAHNRKTELARIQPGVGAIWPTFGSPAIDTFPLENGTLGTALLPAEAEGRANVSAESLDLWLAHRWMASHCFWGKFALGFHYGHIFADLEANNQGFDAFSDPLAPTILQTSTTFLKRRSFMLGPRVGTEAFAELPCGFAVVGRFGGSLLIGSTRSNFEETAELLFPAIPSGETLEVKVHRGARIITSPYVDLRVGALWSLCCPKLFKATVEVGFEVWGYINAVDRITLNHTKSTLSGGCENVCFDAFYLRLQIELCR